MNTNDRCKRCVYRVHVGVFLLMTLASSMMASSVPMLLLRPEDGELFLSEDQHLLYGQTWHLVGGDEAEPLQACEDLLKDQTIPYDVYRWAYLRRIDYYTVSNRENKAIEIGRQWVREHPDDPINIHIWNTLIRICGTRRHDDFKPTVADLESVAEPVFSLFSPYSLEVVDAHSNYAFGLYQYGILANDLTLYARALNQLQEADSILEKMLTMPVLLEESANAEYEISRRRNEIASGIERISTTLETAAQREQQKTTIYSEEAAAKAWAILTDND